MLLQTIILEHDSDLTRLLPDWWALWSRTEQATPFQSPAWLLPWWQAFGPGRLFTAAVRRDGLLVGLAPFYIEDGAFGRRLLPLGIGVTDYLDILIEGAPIPAVAAAIAGAYREKAAHWDSWALEELAPGALAHRLPIADMLDHEGAQSACPVLVLPGSEAEWRRTAAGRRWRKSWNRIARHDAAEIVEAGAIDAGALLEDLIDLHTRRWTEAGEPGVLADPAVRTFHRTAVPRLLASNLLRLFGLRVGGRMVAAYYGLAHRGQAYAYLNGFDPAAGFDSPGTALIGHAMRDLMTTGGRTFHFLRGREPYKYSWGATDRWSVVRRVGSGPFSDRPRPEALDRSAQPA